LHYGPWAISLFQRGKEPGLVLQRRILRVSTFASFAIVSSNDRPTFLLLWLVSERTQRSSMPRRSWCRSHREPMREQKLYTRPSTPAPLGGNSRRGDPAEENPDGAMETERAISPSLDVKHGFASLTSCLSVSLSLSVEPALCRLFVCSRHARSHTTLALPTLSGLSLSQFRLVPPWGSNFGRSVPQIQHFT